ncbi:MAG: hypothetical protein KAF64_15530 [Hydrogenophaga sp.]|nr:hypothetical protein [Hydrogenophaga sp.]
MEPRRRWLWFAASGLLVVLMAATAFLVSDRGQRLYAEASSRSPQELIRYAQHRLEGHRVLEGLLLPGLHALQRRWERTPPPGPLPTLGKGQQMVSMAPPMPEGGTVIRVDTAAGLAQALREAGPGTHIVIAPGRYSVNKTLRLGQDGLAQAPILVSALVPGSVQLDFTQVAGIQIDRPYWAFENLDIRGACAREHDCEHAFHVVGRGAFATLRNNHVQDFNAHIKVNGLDGEWPDHGLVAFNTLTNRATRQTDRPVVMLDLVGASHWKVQDNLVTNFAKGQGNRVAYGLFMKGASEGGRIERNLVICSPTDVSRPGERVGISFGGGGTQPAAVCRSDGCAAFEHRHGLAANNIVAHCNDAGLDINRASDIVLAHNTLINTAGVSARRAPAQARVLSNLFEGNISQRDGAALGLEWNTQAPMAQVFVNPDALLLQWFEPPETIPSRTFVTNDFRGLARRGATLPGALEQDFPGKPAPVSAN